MSRRVAVLAGAMLALCVTPLFAQSAAPQETYGAGVHAYFSGDYHRAYDLLTSIIDTSTDDPRVYYFRGLAELPLGREYEAKQDFQQGAKLEAKTPERIREVAKSLERIQGPSRALLERYRVNARHGGLRAIRGTPQGPVRSDPPRGEPRAPAASRRRAGLQARCAGAKGGRANQT